MKIRQHRGSLSDSMETAEDIAPTIEAIKAYFIKNSDPIFYSLYQGDIEVKPYGFDERINWNTHIITVNGNAVGFTDRAIEG